MKFLKIPLILAGVVALIVAAVLLGNTFVNLNSLTNVANANNSKQPFPNPFNSVAIEVGIAAAAGLLLGLGVGLPRHTARTIRHEALDDAAAQRQATIASRATGTEPQR